MAELTLESRAIPGPPLRNGRPRQRPFAPRPGRKKRPKDLTRQTTFSGKVNAPYRRYLDRLCAHMGIDSSEFVRRATDVLAAASGFEPPPPWDLTREVAGSATPALPGLDVAGTGQLTADGPPSA